MFGFVASTRLFSCQHTTGAGGEGKESESPGATRPMDTSDLKTLVDDLVLMPKVEQITKPSGDYMEIDFEWKRELDDEDFCGLISQGSRKWQGTNSPGTPGYCFGCAVEDLKASKLRGRKSEFNCEDLLRDVTSSTGSRIRLLGGGFDYGIPEGCYSNSHRIEDGWQVILSLTAEDGCKTTARDDPRSVMGKLLEYLQGGYEIPEGFVIDPLGVLEEEPSRHGVRRGQSQGLQTLTPRIR